jgi:hypothetical protein
MAARIFLTVILGPANPEAGHPQEDLHVGHKTSDTTRQAGDWSGGRGHNRKILGIKTA